MFLKYVNVDYFLEKIKSQNFEKINLYSKKNEKQ